MSAAVAVPGVRVGCEYRLAHLGTVLAPDDPRAWVGTIAFPDGTTVTELGPHVQRCVATIPGFLNKVPVLWDFGRVYWERPSDLLPVSVSP